MKSTRDKVEDLKDMIEEKEFELQIIRDALSRRSAQLYEEEKERVRKEK